MNRNGKLNLARGGEGSAVSSLRVSSPMSQNNAATGAARLQTTAQTNAVPPTNPQPNGIAARAVQGGYGVSGSKLQGQPLEGKTLTGRRVKLR